MLPIRASAESIAIVQLERADDQAIARIAELLRERGATLTLVRGHGEGTQLRELLDEIGPDLVGVHGALDERSILALRRSIPDGSTLARLAAGPAQVEDRYFDLRLELDALPELVTQIRGESARARATATATAGAPALRVVELPSAAGPSGHSPAHHASSASSAEAAVAEHEQDAARTRVLDVYFNGALPTLPAAWVLDAVQLDHPGERGVLLMLGHPSLGLAVELTPLDPSTRAYASTRDLCVGYRRPRREVPGPDLRAILDALVGGLRIAEREGPTPLPARLFDDRSERPDRPELPGAPRRNHRPALVCIQPWVQMEVVDPNGLVHQCCSEWTVGHRGAFPRRSLLELWNGPEYQAARRAMVHDVGSLCRPICPRLEDHKFSEQHFRVESGAPRFMKNQLLLAEDLALAREQMRARPIQLALCPSTYCNYDCIMCTYGRTPRRDLPDEIWEQVSELLPTLRSLGLLGGEPLANASAMSFLRRWKRDDYPDAMVDLVTNGALLTERALAHLTSCRFGSITVSLNAGTPEVYEQVQRGLALATVLANIDAIRNYRRDVGDEFRLTLSFVAMPQNIETLHAFGQLAHERDLPIRLLPLTLGSVEELDFYGDPDALARVLEHVRRFRAWVEQVRPAWLPEVRGLEAGIRGEAGSRRPRLPVISGD